MEATKKSGDKYSEMTRHGVGRHDGQMQVRKYEHSKSGKKGPVKTTATSVRQNRLKRKNKLSKMADIKKEVSNIRNKKLRNQENGVSYCLETFPARLGEVIQMGGEEVRRQ